MQATTQVASRKARKVGPAPALTFQDGALFGDRILLDRKVTMIGRSASNECILHDPRISRVHAEIRKEAGSFIVTDLGSCSGTSRNGEPLTGPTTIRHGDQIGFGPLLATLENLDADDEADTLAFPGPETAIERHLSPRQQQVLELMAEGMTNHDIGEVMSITERTVKAYAQEIYDRLGVHKRAGAVAQGVKRGLI